ncbi:hypothetical protein QF032_004192 [Streptomyces achromogenes]|uniref:Lipoprotein n=1 Tax=Streptomyces achromogenes TaxID=67255 RepID=A0ABU0Q3C9_STRAH|nr:hypothetical protein [Streptomyces achromogenes]MDQ0832348.1 hypothetical protein [Streptomyces achromogenes]
MLGVMASVALTSACDSGGSADPSPSKPPSGMSSPSAISDGASGKAVLDHAFVGMEPLGSGSGRLQPHLGNTLPATPENVLSVTFAFTCTGKGKVVFAFTVNGRNVPTGARTTTCDGSIFQRSIEVSRTGLISYEAQVTGSESGSFAYSYYTEKAQLP